MQLLVPAPVSARALRSRRGIGFGQRFFLLLALGLIWVMPMFWAKEFGYGLLAWDALLLVGWMFDYSQLSRSFALLVTREFESPPAIVEETEVALKLRNIGPLDMVIEVRETVPPAIVDEPPHFTLKVPAKTERVGRYTIAPKNRGDVTLGGVYLRIQSLLRLAEIWAEAPLTERVRVYPNLEAAKSHSLFLVRSRMIEQQRRLMQHRGIGREFESLREYQEGDEQRDICWTATARRAKLVTRLYQAERSQAVWIVIDTGRLLRARVGNMAKLDHAVNTALSLSQLALHSGDRVGLLAYGRKVRNRVPLGRSNEHLRVIIDQLAQISEETAEADHLRIAATLMQMQTRRALIVWLTDFPETSRTPDVIEAATILSKRHLVLLAAIGQKDLREMSVEAPASGDVDGLYRYTAVVETMQRRDLMLARLREQGALAFEVEAKDLTAAVLNNYLMIKERSAL